MKTLNDLFLDELADIYYAEKRLVKALPKLIKAATDQELKEAITSHLAETEGHVQKVEKVFELFNEKVRSKKCDAMVGLLEESDSITSDFKGSPAINAAIISAGQKVEHYEIASYGCLSAWAEVLGNQKASSLLHEILDEEEAANDKLTEIADSTSNAEAAQGGEGEEDEEDEDEESEHVTSGVARKHNRR